MSVNNWEDLSEMQHAYAFEIIDREAKICLERARSERSIYAIRCMANATALLAAARLLRSAIETKATEDRGAAE